MSAANAMVLTAKGAGQGHCLAGSLWGGLGRRPYLGCVDVILLHIAHDARPTPLLLGEAIDKDLPLYLALRLAPSYHVH